MLNHEPRTQSSESTAAQTTASTARAARLAAGLGEYSLAGALLAIDDGGLPEVLHVHSDRDWLLGVIHKRGSAYVAVRRFSIIAFANDVRASRRSVVGMEFETRDAALASF